MKALAQQEEFSRESNRVEPGARFERKAAGKGGAPGRSLEPVTAASRFQKTKKTYQRSKSKSKPAQKSAEQKKS
jgi:hypothetical protein